jgi:hypothetical protein
MRFILELVFLCILFYFCLRYDLGITPTISISRSILFTLVIGVIYLVTIKSTREGATSAFPGLVMGNSSNYFGTSKTDEMSESEEDTTDEESTDEESSGDEKKKKKKKK